MSDFSTVLILQAPDLPNIRRLSRKVKSQFISSVTDTTWTHFANMKFANLLPVNVKTFVCSLY